MHISTLTTPTTTTTTASLGEGDPEREQLSALPLVAALDQRFVDQRFTYPGNVPEANVMHEHVR